MNDIKILKSSALFSPKKQFRYRLYRRWVQSLFAPRLMIIGLNPSIAGKKYNDPTATRSIRFAYDLGFGSLVMANEFAHVATDPKDLKKVKHPIGKRNNKIIKRAARVTISLGGKIVAAWGNDGSYLDRDKEVIELLKYYDLYCFGITKQNQPKHPLFLRADTKLELWKKRFKQRTKKVRI